MLGQLPLEIIRLISVYLSPEAALSFTHICRHTYWAFDDWSIWRNIVKGSALLRIKSLSTGIERHCALNSPMMAHLSVAQSGDAPHNVTAVEQYAPQLMVLGCKNRIYWESVQMLTMVTDTMAAPLDLQIIYDQCRALVSRQEYPSSLVRAKADDSKWFEFMTDPTSRFETRAWLSAQTASLCFAAGALSNTGYVYQSEEPFARLEDVQWFKSTTNQRNCSDSLVMQHALANAAVGSFCLELRAALYGERTIGEDFAGTSSPPTTSNIPLASQIATGLPSLQDSVKDSPPSCLMATVGPDFFVNQAWTGYLSTRGDWRSVYHGIGCHNLRDLPSAHFVNHVSSAKVPIAVDHRVRFRIIESLANGDFVLQSNYFHTRDDMYSLTMLVERRTGRLSICMSRPGDATPRSLQAESRNALNTPFGIVYGIEPGSWLWLWKAEWSEGQSDAR